MMVIVLQVLLALFACARLVAGVAKYVRKERAQSLFKLVASVLIWGAIAVFALFPQWARALSQRAGFGENLNTLIFVGFVVVFAILFKLLAIIERLERSISEIVRKEALQLIVDARAAGTSGTRPPDIRLPD
jgi:hypothetical protein